MSSNKTKYDISKGKYTRKRGGVPRSTPEEGESLDSSNVAAFGNTKNTDRKRRYRMASRPKTPPRGSAQESEVQQSDTDQNQMDTKYGLPSIMRRRRAAGKTSAGARSPQKISQDDDDDDVQRSKSLGDSPVIGVVVDDDSQVYHSSTPGGIQGVSEMTMAEMIDDAKPGAFAFGQDGLVRARMPKQKISQDVLTSRALGDSPVARVDNDSRGAVAHHHVSTRVQDDGDYMEDTTPLVVRNIDSRPDIDQDGTPALVTLGAPAPVVTLGARTPDQDAPPPLVDGTARQAIDDAAAAAEIGSELLVGGAEVVDDREERQRELNQLRSQHQAANRLYQQRPLVPSILVRVEQDGDHDESVSSDDGGRNLKLIFRLQVVSLVLVVIAATVIGVVVSKNNKDGSSPSSSPQETSPPTSAPFEPPPHRFYCSRQKSELLLAVDQYLQERPNFTKADTFGSPIGDWCVSVIQDFGDIFSVDRNSAAAAFDESLSEWDTSRATTLEGLFRGNSSARSPFNQDLTSWDVSKVESLDSTFYRAKAFNQDISRWNTSNVKDMFNCFADADDFNQDLSTWDVSSVVLFEQTFSNAFTFNQDISKWDTSSANTMRGMFTGAIAFQSDISAWDVSGVTSFTDMFNGAIQFNSDLASWDVSKCTTMRGMFRQASEFDQDLSEWNTSQVQKMEMMFLEAVNFNQNLGGWDVSRVDTMWRMFEQAKDFNYPLGAWDVSKVENFENMFLGASSFNQSLCSWGGLLRKDARVQDMFLNTACPDLSDPDLSADPPGPFCHPCNN